MIRGLHEERGRGDWRWSAGPGYSGARFQYAVRCTPSASASTVRMTTVHDLAAATGRLPHLTSWLAHPSGPSPKEQFRLGLGFLLDRIARCLTGAETRARSDTMGR